MYLPVVLAGVVLIIGFVLGEKIYAKNAVPESFSGLVLVITWLIASLSGFIQISIEEVPGSLLRVEGKAAVFAGILWIGILWLLSGWTIWYYFF